MNDNKYSEMLTYFLDGELDQASETELFSQLADDKELQNEMNEILAIRKSVQADNSVFNPPVESTVAIFSAIGFSLPETDKPAPIKDKPIFTWQYKVLTAIVLATLVTYFLISGYYDSKIDSLQQQITSISGSIIKLGNNQANTNTGMDNLQGNITPKANYPVITSNETSEVAKTTGNLPARRKSIPADKSVVTNITTEVETLPAQSFVPINNATIEPITDKSIGWQKFPSLDPTIPGNINSNEQLPAGVTGNSGYSIYLRGLTQFSLPSTYVPTNADPFFKFMSVGLYRSFSSIVKNSSVFDDLKLGLDFGQEPFRMDYFQNKTDYSSRIVRNPMLFWCTLSCRVEYKPVLLNSLRPYNQLSIGGTEYGSLAKLQAGLQYDLTDNFGINLGIEGSSLFFNQKPEWYSAEKLNIIYSMSIKF